MLPDDLSKVCQALALLREVAVDPESKCDIGVDTGYDEAALVGKADAYVALAVTLLRLVCEAEAGQNASPALPDAPFIRIDRRGNPNTNAITGNLSELGDVWIVVAYLAKNDVEFTRLTERG